MTKPPEPDEHTIQRQLFTWAEMQTGKHPCLELLHCIPNGQYRPGQRMEPGVLKGVPDVMLPVARQGCHGLYIELKTKSGTVRRSQQRIISRLRREGYRVAVCRTLDDAIQTIREYLGG